MATKSISQLDTQATANETDLFEVAMVDQNSASGYASKKESAAAIADAIVGEYQYPLRLTETTSKKISGAINEVASEVADLKDLEGNASGAIATFADGSDNPLRALTISIVATQSLWGDASPSNERNIGGYNGLSIANSKNDIYDSAGTVAQGSSHSRKHVDIINSKSIKVYTTGTAGFNYMASKQELSSYTLTVGKTYAIYANVTEISENATPAITIRNSDNTIQEATYIQGIGYHGIVFTYNPTIHNYISFFATWETSVVASVTYDDITFKEIDESISWEDTAGTVYGGTLNVKTGELIVTHGNIAEYDGETINEPWISSMDKYVAGATPTTGAQVVYPLTTPITYQLTPVQVRSLLGINNIWADCGEITELKYTRDLNLCINDIISRIEALEGGSSSRSISVSPNLTKSIVSELDTAEGKTEEETEEETKEEAQNER